MLDKAAKKCMIPLTAACLHAWAQGTLFTFFTGTNVQTMTLLLLQTLRRLCKIREFCAEPPWRG
jgi:hypothetical protein